MASVERQVRNGQLRWQARWRDDAGRQKKTFDRKIDAERFLATVEHGILTGSYVDRPAGAPSATTY